MKNALDIINFRSFPAMHITESVREHLEVYYSSTLPIRMMTCPLA